MQTLPRPFLIALVAALGFGGAWFAVMRPSARGGGSAPTASAVSRANGAEAAKGKTAAERKAAAGQDALTGTHPPGQDAPAAGRFDARAATGDLSAPILRELARGKVAVLLFWNRRAADDRAARRAVAALDRRGGKVAVHVAPVGRVGKYDAITQGIEVLQSPTILVIGPDRLARTITGFTDADEVDQLVGDVGGRLLRAKR